MKSKFLGLSAKLALAVLAVGFMFTSCYDSENGDVSKPYKAPNAVYTFVVSVTNGVTNLPVDNAAVSVNALSTVTCASVGNGVYQVVVTNDQTATKMPSSVTVNVAGTADYSAESKSVTVAEIVNGQAVTCYVNIIVNPSNFLPEGLTVNATNRTSYTSIAYTGDPTLDGENVDYVGDVLDIVNDTNEPVSVSKTIEVYTGIKYTTPVQAVTRSVDVVKEINDYICGVEGVSEITDNFATELRTYEFLLPAFSALQKISVEYFCEDINYDFTYNGVSYKAATKRIVNVVFSNTPVLLESYHGHGHGHGHGGDLNAGGGIFE